MPEFVNVTLGDHNIVNISRTKTERTFKLSSQNIVVHPLYNYDTQENDIAKLYLDQPIDFAKNPKIRQICLPASANEEYIGRDAKATGWGLMKRRTPAEVLQEINTRIISRSECNQRLRNFHKRRALPYLATEKVICAQGDVPKQGSVPRICRGRYLARLLNLN